MSEKLDIITIGESLIELSSERSLLYTECLSKYYGGDAITTAMTALKLGSKVGYITCVGNDFFKDFLIDSWTKAGLDISKIKITEDFNGLYLIALLEDGKKELAYYRKKTAATKLSVDDISEDYIENSKYIYSTGVAQSISLSAKEAIKKAFTIAREKGVTTAYDPNYQPMLMNIEESREFLKEIIPYTDIIFLNKSKDGKRLLELDSHEQIIKYFWDLGVNMVILKSKEDYGFYIGYNGDINFTPYFKTEIVDTTCAGDAFNGGFLHALNSGLTPFEASQFASVVSGLQSQNIGAIKSIPTKEDVYRHFQEVQNS